MALVGARGLVRSRKKRRRGMDRSLGGGRGLLLGGID